MSERVSSLLILLGGILAVIALWLLTIFAIRKDTRRRGLSEVQQKAWTAAAVALPLFGFALYMALRVIRQHLTPPSELVEEDDGRITFVHPPGGNGKGPRHDVPAGTIPAGQRPLQSTYRLTVTEGPHMGQQFIIHRLPALVGRGEDAAVPLDADLIISRHHAELYVVNGSLRIRDLHSTHGTQVNGKTVTDHPLAPGDTVSIGLTVLVVQVVET